MSVYQNNANNNNLVRHSTPKHGGHAFRVWTKPGDRPLSAFAARVTPPIYGHLAERTGIPDPAEKEDLVAALAFRNAAMENWGLMIFRGGGLLDDRRGRVERKRS